jgi:hypothetical protein
MNVYAKLRNAQFLKTWIRGGGGGGWMEVPEKSPAGVARGSTVVTPGLSHRLTANFTLNLLGRTQVLLRSHYAGNHCHCLTV